MPSALGQGLRTARHEVSTVCADASASPCLGTVLAWFQRTSTSGASPIKLSWLPCELRPSAILRVTPVPSQMWLPRTPHIWICWICCILVLPSAVSEFLHRSPVSATSPEANLASTVPLGSPPTDLHLHLDPACPPCRSRPHRLPILPRLCSGAAMSSPTSKICLASRASSLS